MAPDQAAPVPAGWYPDPYGASELRWWDGQNWTESIHPPVAAPPAPPAPAPPAQEPAAQQPVMQQPAAQEPVVQQPAVQQPPVQTPAVQEPVAQESVLPEPAAQQQPAQEPDPQYLGVEALQFQEAPATEPPPAEAPPAQAPMQTAPAEAPPGSSRAEPRRTRAAQTVRRCVWRRGELGSRATEGASERAAQCGASPAERKRETPGAPTALEARKLAKRLASRAKCRGVECRRCVSVALLSLASA